ncbi:putative sushi, von Willebrand factor type A [Apostichopus japonicus]|uniref:Putative sushi, von Willebrand factor type A n=1 Tax=Stichopus japonicus TaxID=307972 RepID=A0A2G8LMY3_STIJA|nr:putative sushi, von Willebrand factor type A [Apostichopus japonicus]
MSSTVFVRSALGVFLLSIVLGLTQGQCLSIECEATYFDPDLVITPNQDCFADGSSVTLSCSVNLGGPPFNTCDNGTWEFPSASCDGFTCARPIVGDSVVVTPDKLTYLARESVNFSCVANNLTGPSMASCGPGGIWEPNPLPVCETLCDVPPDIVNGNVNITDPIGIGDEVEIICKANYSVPAGEEPFIRCNGEQWSSIPTCYSRCSVPVVLNSDSEVTDILLHNERKVIECNISHSFDQQNSFNVTCNNGSIEGLYPQQCFADCEAFAPPLNGTIMGGNLHGQVAKISCDNGYIISGPAFTTCIDGKWTNDTSGTACLAACDEPYIPNGKVVTTGPFFVGDTAEVVCLPGNDFESGANSSMMTCQNNSIWGTTPQCFGRCHFPGVPFSNSSVAETRFHNDQKLIICDVDYTFNQQRSFSVNCNNGTIEGLLPSQCFADCVALDAPLDGSVTSGHLHGQVATYSCDDRYQLAGNATTTCMNGKWGNNEPPPVCVALFCTVPIPQDENVNILPFKDLYNSLETIEYSCADNFVLKGNSTAECKRGTWNPPEYPSCEAYEELTRQLNESSNMLSENSTKEEVESVAETIELATTDENFVQDEPERIDLIADSLEAVANAGEPSVEITDPVVSSINNLMEFEEDALQNSTSGTARIIAANKSCSAQHGGRRGISEFCQCFSSWGNSHGRSYSREENTQLYDDMDDIPLTRTAASISVPSSVITELNGKWYYSIKRVGGKDRLSGLTYGYLPGKDCTSTDESGRVRISFFIYGNAVLFNPSRMYEPLNSSSSNSTESFTDTIASQIISARLEGEGLSTSNEWISESSVLANFRTNLTDRSKDVVLKECVFWSYDDTTAEGYWSNEGCKTRQDEDGLVVCSCKRLASFAVLIRLRKDGPLPPESLYWITLIGSIISVFCLVICIISFLFVKKMRDQQPAVLHINLCVSLLGFYIAFLSSERAFEKTVRCAVASAAIHYFCLATVMWMTMEAVNMYRMLIQWTKGLPNMRQFVLVSCLVGYGAPLIPVLLVSFLDRNILDGKNDYCFLQPGPSLYYGFFAIVAALFLFNMLYIHTSDTLCNVQTYPNCTIAKGEAK